MLDSSAGRIRISSQATISCRALLRVAALLVQGEACEAESKGGGVSLSPAGASPSEGGSHEADVAGARAG